MKKIRFGKTNWQISPWGFGCHRIEESEPAHKKALKMAIRLGCNLIDTSVEAQRGSSERLIGQTLQELIHDGSIRRDEIFIVSKAELPFFNETLSKSLARLQTEVIDVFLVNHPERHQERHPETFEEDLYQHFVLLEHEVQRGRIRHYGISSSALSHSSALSLAKILDCAKRAAREVHQDPRIPSHFSVLEFPLNLFEPAATLTPTQEGWTVLQFAQAHDIATLTNRPLNAFAEKRVYRLAAFPSHHGLDVVTHLNHSFGRLLEFEQNYPGKEHLHPSQVCWGHLIKKQISEIHDPVIWREVFQTQLSPAFPKLNTALASLSVLPDCQPWARQYRPLLDRTLEALEKFFEAQAAEESRKITVVLHRLCPELKTSPSLAQKAVRVVQSLPSVHCTLIGMRQESYVREFFDTTEGSQTLLSPELAQDVLKKLSAWKDLN